MLRNRFAKHEFDTRDSKKSKVFLEENLHHRRMVATFARKIPSGGDFALITIFKDLLLKHWSV
jgi:hypothetical protein